MKGRVVFVRELRMTSPAAANAVGPPWRSWRRRLLAPAALVVAGAVCLVVYSEATAPNPFPPSRSTVIGTWQSHSGAVLTLRPDGTFVAARLPADFGGFPAGALPRSGSGQWHVGPVPAEPPGVIFNFSKRLWVELLVERLGSAVVMYYDTSDPDEGASGQYQFMKVR